MRLAGRRVVVTGATSGIGREITRGLALRGASVVAVGRGLAAVHMGMQDGVALHNILVHAHPKAVWDVLSDPYSYDRWVIGTRKIVHADPDWPAVGSSFRFEAGFGPLRFRSQTAVRDSEEPGRLELEADVWPLGAGVATEIKPWGSNSLVVLEEHWIRGPYFLLANPLLHLALNIRNRFMVKGLAEAAQSRRYRT